MRKDNWEARVRKALVLASVSVVVPVAYGAAAAAEQAPGAVPAAPSASYKGYGVVATRAERVGNVVSATGYHREERLYAGDGHWLVTVSLRFEAVPAPASTAGFIADDRTAHIDRSEVTLHDPSSGASYFPSSWKGSSWAEWSREDEVLKFNKEKTKADKTYLFRVPTTFDRKVSELRLGDQVLKLSFKRQKWDKD